MKFGTIKYLFRVLR